MPRTIHAYLDYAFGLLLLMTPWVFGFHPGMPTILPVVLGLAVICYSLFTNYEGGLIRIIPFKGHLLLDVLAALTFLIARYMIRTGGVELDLYVAFGIFLLLLAALTRQDAKGPVPHFR